MDKVVENYDLVFHTHIATWAKLRAPGEEPCDFSPFAKALSMAGYGGDMTVEGMLADMSELALAKVYNALREAFA